MKIVADRDIPQAAQAFGELGEVSLLPGREIGRDDLRDCRCLVVRTVTRVDERLLAGTPVEFVGSTTIGTDHLDLDYLARAGIACSNAAGCNAEAAAEYVISGLFALSEIQGFDPLRRRAGIVGCGNVGSRLRQKLEVLGIETLVNDPPLVSSGRGEHDFVDLDTILGECDFVSLHVPLTRGGAHPTFHLLDAARLERLAAGALLVNAARGEVVDNAALLEVIERRADLAVFLDTWEGEPQVSRRLLRAVALATPHIAGYSVEGRLRGTQMVLDAACRHFGTVAKWQMAQLLPAVTTLRPEAADSESAFWQGLFRRHFDIRRDHEAFISGAGLRDSDFAAHFDSLRRVYPDRLEYERFRVAGRAAEPYAARLAALGFRR